MVEHGLKGQFVTRPLLGAGLIPPRHRSPVGVTAWMVVVLCSTIR